MKVGDIAIPRANVWLRIQYSDHRSDPLPCAVVVSVHPFVLGNLGDIRYFWVHRDPEDFDFIGPAEAQECGEMALTWWEEDQRAAQAARDAQRRTPQPARCATCDSSCTDAYTAQDGLLICCKRFGRWKPDSMCSAYSPRETVTPYSRGTPDAQQRATASEATQTSPTALHACYRNYAYLVQPGQFCCPTTGEMHDMREPLNALLGVETLNIALMYASDRSEFYCFYWQSDDRSGFFNVQKSQLWTPDFVIARRFFIHPVSSQNHDH